MEIAYFSTEHDIKEGKLLRAMKAVLPKEQITTFSDIEKLKDDLLLGPRIKNLSHSRRINRGSLAGYLLHSLSLPQYLNRSDPSR